MEAFQKGPGRPQDNPLDGKTVTGPFQIRLPNAPPYSRALQRASQTLRTAAPTPPRVRIWCRGGAARSAAHVEASPGPRAPVPTYLSTSRPLPAIHLPAYLRTSRTTSRATYLHANRRPYVRAVCGRRCFEAVVVVHARRVRTFVPGHRRIPSRLTRGRGWARQPGRRHNTTAAHVRR